MLDWVNPKAQNKINNGSLKKENKPQISNAVRVRSGISQLIVEFPKQKHKNVNCALFSENKWNVSPSSCMCIYLFAQRFLCLAEVERFVYWEKKKRKCNENKYIHHDILEVFDWNLPLIELNKSKCHMSIMVSTWVSWCGSCALFFCNDLMLPNWRISTTSCTVTVVDCTTFAWKLENILLLMVLIKKHHRCSITFFKCSLFHSSIKIPFI